MARLIPQGSHTHVLSMESKEGLISHKTVLMQTLISITLSGISDCRPKIRISGSALFLVQGQLENKGANVVWAYSSYEVEPL